MDDLAALRAALAACDRELLRAIAARRAAVAAVAAAKASLGKPPFDPAAEAARDRALPPLAASLDVPPALARAALTPLYDDALAGQCAAALLALPSALVVHVSAAVAPLAAWLDDAGIFRVAAPEGALCLHGPDEAPPAEAAAAAAVTLPSPCPPSPLRVTIALAPTAGPAAPARQLLEALGAHVR